MHILFIFIKNISILLMTKYDFALKISLLIFFYRTLIFAIPIEPTESYKKRQNFYIQSSLSCESFHCQILHILKKTPVSSLPFLSHLSRINNKEDCADFSISAILRMLYIDKETQGIPNDLREEMKKAVLGFKYWFDEPGASKMFFTTENHEILFHSSELLAGALFKEEKFTNSGMTGLQHMQHAIPYINEWIKHRGETGFTEWHSSIYANELMGALINLADYSENQDISTKAAMLLDLLAFSFGSNYFKGTYAVPHSRINDEHMINKKSDSTNDVVWLMLGLDCFVGVENLAASFLASSKKYIVPPILEFIANDAKDYFEHKEQSSVKMKDAKKYNIGFETIYDRMFWTSNSAFLSPQAIEGMLDLYWKYDLSADVAGINHKLFVIGVKILSWIHFAYPSGFSNLIRDITEGAALENANVYTYRTPYYQISACQDRQKGMLGMQDTNWQVTLGKKAKIFGNSPGSFRGTHFAGGWKPKATFYKNVGILQYDRNTQLPLMELLFWCLGWKDDIHIFFPKAEFNTFLKVKNWYFAEKDKGYIALYSHENMDWEIDDIVLQTHKSKNAYIIELASHDTTTFYNFVDQITKSDIEVIPEKMGYKIIYNSPSQGKIEVSWDGDMKIQGKDISIGPYPRFENKYTKSEFGQNTTNIIFADQSLYLKNNY